MDRAGDGVGRLGKVVVSTINVSNVISLGARSVDTVCERDLSLSIWLTEYMIIMLTVYTLGNIR